MAGVLSLGVQAGSLIKFSSTPIMLRVVEVLNNGLQVRVQVGNREFVLSDDERTEVLPDVHVFCGVSEGSGWNMPYKSKLAFEAPTDILIHRAGVEP